jgi:hypothetical protein
VLTDVSEESITYVFSVENRASKTSQCCRWLGLATFISTAGTNLNVAETEFICKTYRACNWLE